jgi:hypothetical protein
MDTIAAPFILPDLLLILFIDLRPTLPFAIVTTQLLSADEG